MRRSNDHRYFLYPRRTPARPPLASKWQTCCRSYACGVHLGSPTFVKKPFSSSSQPGTVLQLLQTVTQARFYRSSSSCAIGPIVLANCLPIIMLPLRGAHATHLWKVKQTFLSYAGTRVLFHEIHLGLCPCLSSCLAASDSTASGSSQACTAPTVAAGANYCPFLSL